MSNLLSSLVLLSWFLSFAFCGEPFTFSDTFKVLKWNTHLGISSQKNYLTSTFLSTSDGITTKSIKNE
jgi:hypothetical protein